MPVELGRTSVNTVEIVKGLEPGDQFVVVAGKDAVILKAIAAPTMDEFDELLAEARKQARRAGLKRSDVAHAVAETRRGR